MASNMDILGTVYFDVLFLPLQNISAHGKMLVLYSTNSNQSIQIQNGNCGFEHLLLCTSTTK